jgi:hypothetical protein
MRGPGVMLGPRCSVEHSDPSVTGKEAVRMPDFFLTGAGFSRNWGGWLADEVFEYLLGCPEITPEIVTRLWKSKNSGLGFENTLQELRTETAAGKTAAGG